ncbi:MAG: hypothetical protein LBH28_00275 [Oscillospiraceae bacterium]|jgi:hypothetical protein|nr:hypothetical protein [Oscillospiraceae bacterium]
MSAEQDSYYNLAERIDDDFMEIDSDVCADLRNTNSEYVEMRREAMKLQDDFPAITQIIDGDGDVSLSVEESRAMARWLNLNVEMENIERKQIYFRGHADSYHYLKKIGVI